MGTVTEIDDGLVYETDNNKIAAVSWQKRGQFVHFRNDGFVSALQKIDGTGIGKHELRQLMIMWLALNYPDTLAYDELEREEKIKVDT
jgi:hypothetical protein